MQNSVLSSLKTTIFETAKQLLTLTVSNVGEGTFKQCNQQQFQQLPQQTPHSQFYVQQQQEYTGGIKGAGFNKFINIGYEKIENIVNADPQDLGIGGYRFIVGGNDGNRTVEMVQKKMMRTLGTNLYYNDEVYPGLVDRRDGNYHSHDICAIYYDEQNTTIFTGTSGKSSEIFEWLLQDEELVFQRKMNLPLNSLGVAFLFRNKQLLMCITQCSLHRQSELFGFDLEEGKRVRYEVNMGKVIGVVGGEEIFVVNQGGLQRLVINQRKNSVLEEVYKSESAITCIQGAQNGMIVVGKMDGTVELIETNSKAMAFSFKLSMSPVSTIKKGDNNNILVGTHGKQLFLLQVTEDQQQKLKQINKVQLKQSVKQCLIDENTIYCIQKYGKIQSISLPNLDKNPSKIQDDFDLNSHSQISDIIYNKQGNQYCYYFKNSERINFFKLDKSHKPIKHSTISLLNPTVLLDTHSNIIISIFQQQKLGSSSKLGFSQFSQQGLQFYDFILGKSLNILEDLQINAQCSCIKLNPDGDKAIIGCQDGKILIYNDNNPKMPAQICRSSSGMDDSAGERIQQAIWSCDGRFIKIITTTNLLFFSFTKIGEDAYQLKALHKLKSTERQTLKSALSKAEWVEQGRFSWRTSKAWSQATTTTQIKDVKSIGKLLLTSIQGGFMRVYDNPSSTRHSTLCRWFDSNYKFLTLTLTPHPILLIFSKHTMICISLE